MSYGIKSLNRVDPTPMEKSTTLSYQSINQLIYFMIVYVCARMYAFMCMHDVCIVRFYAFIHVSMRMYVCAHTLLCV